MTFWARLFEDCSPVKPEDELLPSDYEPISSPCERSGELLDIHQLTTLMGEELPGDLVAKLEADRDSNLATVPIRPAAPARREADGSRMRPT